MDFDCQDVFGGYWLGSKLFMQKGVDEKSQIGVDDVIEIRSISLRGGAAPFDQIP
jgi:hypothetical protein